MAPQKRSTHSQRLDMAVAQVQQRWGVQALRRLSPAEAAAPPPALATGFASLDAATGIGGFPRGQISELCGPATSGKTTLALIVLAHAQRCGGIVAYFDLEQALDPDYARRCGIDLHRLLIIHPPDQAEALPIAASLARRQGLQLIAFDAGRAPAYRRASSDLRLLSLALAGTPCSTLFLTTAAPGVAGPHEMHSPSLLANLAALRLEVIHEQWEQQPWGDVTGYKAVIVTRKNKMAAPGRRAVIRITFNGAVRGQSEEKDRRRP